MYGSVKNDLILAQNAGNALLEAQILKVSRGSMKVAHAAPVTPSPPTSTFLPPTLILIGNPGLPDNIIHNFTTDEAEKADILDKT